jgi:tetratricopeptide (TPR) repeat protein
MHIKLNSSSLFIIILSITFSACSHFNPNLKKAESIMEEYPDSALKILRGIKSPRSLSEKDYALYTLLVTQATDKNDLDLTKDSLSDYAVRYFGESKDSVHAYKSFFYAGRVNEEMKNANQAISYYLKAKDFARNSRDYKYLYLIHYYLGNLYTMQDLFKDGINSDKEAYRYSSILKNKTYQCLSLSEIGSGYFCLKRNDSALIFQLRALNIAKRDYNNYLSNIYYRICRIYIKSGKYIIALHYYNKALACKQKEDDLYTLYSAKGEIYLNIHQHDSAVYYFKKSLQSNFIFTRATVYGLLADTYEAKGNIKKALDCSKKFDIYRDTIDYQTQSAAILQMQEIYKHNNLKEENLLLKQNEIEKNESFYRLSLFTTILILLGGYLYFINYKRIQKQKEQIRHSQELLQEIKIEEVKKEKELIYKEAELKTEFYKRLNSISIPGLINSSNNDKEEQSNTHIKLTEQNWNEIIENTDAVFNNFTRRLKETFPKMNEMDIRLCCLIKVQLSQSAMADILNIEKVSIKRRKLRIRKDKMMLDDGRTLDEIVLNF